MSQSKVCFITGASSGIGAAIAEVYAINGAKIFLAARREDRLKEVAKTCIERGAQQVEFSVVDVCDEESLKQAFEMCADKFGRIDHVYANAGFGITQTFENLTNDHYRRQFETNIFGVLNTARAAAPYLEAAKGSLAIVGSVSSYVNTPTDSPYSMSKAAVRALSDTLYLEWAPKGVSVTFVAPGFVTSEIRHKDNDEKLNPESKDPAPKRYVMDTLPAAKQIVAAVEKRKREVVITLFGKSMVWLRRMFPSVTFMIVKQLSKTYDRARN